MRSRAETAPRGQVAWNNVPMRARPVLFILLVAALAVGGLAYALRDGEDQTSQGAATQRAPAQPAPAAGVTSGPQVGAAKAKLARIGTFDQPVYVSAPPGDKKRLFVVEKPGKIRVIRNGKKLSAPFLNISGDTTKDGEQGLLSVAFAPDYATSGLFYVNYTDRGGDTRIEEFKRSSNANRANRSSRRKVLEIKQPFSNHNGGLVLFGPDKLLYIGMGDGGSGGDPGNRAQNLRSLLGKMLRIDPRRSGSRPYSVPKSNPFVGRTGRDEIYSFGLRNPWRFSFDRRNGALYIGDVGQQRWEEIDYASKGTAKGKNYGWSCREGRHRFDSSRKCANAVGPIFEYSRSKGRCSVTGGVVVRDPKVPNLKGRYLYADFCKGAIRSFKVSGGRARGDRGLGRTVANPASFGEDARGRVYVVSLNGPVFRLKR